MQTLRAVLVDDERLALSYLRELCDQIPELCVTAQFQNPHEAMDYIKAYEPDLAILDIEMPEYNGIDIASQIQRDGLNTMVVFSTGYEQYALDAFRTEAVSYLLKPAQPEDLRRAVQKAIRLLPTHQKQVFVRTFGYFDVFVQGEPLYFSNAKAKELLAVLIDQQGGIVSMDTMIDRLWGDRPYDENVKQLYRKAVNYLNKLFESEELTFFVSNRGSCYVKRSQINCDLFDFMDEKPHAKDAYQGKYLFEYGWSEERMAQLDERVLKNESSTKEK